MEITPITYGNQKNIVRVPRGDDTLLMYEDYQEFPLAIVMGGIPEDGQLPTTGEVEKTNWADAGLVDQGFESLPGMTGDKAAKVPKQPVFIVHSVGGQPTKGVEAAHLTTATMPEPYLKTKMKD